MKRLSVAVAMLVVVWLLAGTGRLNPGGQRVAGAAEEQAAPVEIQVSVVAENLDTPWALAFAPDGRLFFTERPGRVRVIQDGVLRDEPLITLPVRETSESGLLGLAVHPAFPDEPYLYTMYTYASAGDLFNRVVRLRVGGDSAFEDFVLLDGIPGANIHDGGRLKIGPDGLLYVLTGDATEPAQAQNLDSPAGKILRLHLDGSIPVDNPFPGSPVFTYGHRNPEGLDFQAGTGRLYATEHGPTGNDEFNVVEGGANYGWPEAQGERHDGFKAPLRVYSPAIAPAGLAFYAGDAIPQWQGSYLFGTLRGEHLHRIKLDPATDRTIVEEEQLFAGEFGRLRDVVVGPDGALYVSTSNRDGRGNPRFDDDRILRFGPAMR